MDTPFVEPVVDARDQTLSDRVFLHVKPLLPVVLAIAQPMMPAARLKFPIGIFMLPAKLAFPVGDPLLDGDEDRAARRNNADGRASRDNH
jgi:hypothetical protein